MKTITIANQKGGVGKTTTSQAMLEGFRRKGFKVLGIDTDPQSNLSSLFHYQDNGKTIFNVLQKEPILDCIIHTEEGIDLIQGDVVVIEIAGGNTIPTAANIIRKAHEKGSKTIGTAGIFGIGDEEIVVKDISEFDDSNPAVEELRKEGIVKDHLVISTNRFIRDAIPITPYVLDDIANIITREALKLLIEKNNE